MTASDQGIGIEELAARTGVPVRTVRYYIAEGLLPGPEGRGKAAAYREEHVLRLRLIRRLVEQRVPLGEIGERLSRLGLEEVRSLLAEAERQAVALDRAERTASPRDYVSALLNRAQSARQPAREEASQTAGAWSTRQVGQAQQGRQIWQRLELAPGVELHVRADAQRRYRPLIEEVLQLASEMRGPTGADRERPGEQERR